MKISILTATYNAEKFLPGLIESIRNQTDRDFEWVVVDGGSSDGTIALIEASGDLVTRYISERDFGIYDAINKAIRLSCGDYYLVIGADDRLLPEAVELYRQKAQETQAGLVVGAVRIGERAIKPKPDAKISWRRGIWEVVTSHSVGCLIRKSLHEKYGYYSRRYPICADVEFLLKVYDGGEMISRVPQVVGVFSDRGFSGVDYWGSLAENFRVRLERGNPLLGELLLLLLKMIYTFKKGRVLVNKKKIRLF